MQNYSNIQILEFLSALSDGNGRGLRVLCLAYQAKRFTVTQLVEVLEIPQSAVSLRLRPFKELGIIRQVENPGRNTIIYEFVKEAQILFNLDQVSSITPYNSDFQKFADKFLK